ncbi:MAG: N4-gp56 family major capsid protein [Candidatus Atribacteria bacterium]|nr:N4-gp56 family major capsid protein [Candidatus Atribacteria bacterium]
MNLKRMFRRVLLFPLALILGAFPDEGTITTSHKFNKTYYQAQFLEGKENYVVFDQFASREKKAEIPKNDGDTVEFTRIAPFGLKRTALTEGTNPSATKVYGNTVSTTVKEYGDYVKPSKKFWYTSMDKDMAQTAFEHGISAASTIDSLIWEVVAEGGMGLRADADATYSGERTAVASGSSTTVVVTDAIPTGITSGKTGVIVFLTGKNYGQVREFTYLGATSVTLGSAVDHIVADGDLVWMVCTYGLTTGDKVSVELIRKAVAKLEANGVPVFDDGYYHAVYTPLQKYDFQRDDEYINLKHYAAPKDLYRNLDGEIFGVRFHKDTVPYRHTAGTIGTYVASAAVYLISIFGKGAFGNVRISGIDRKYYLCPPVEDPNNPLAMYGSMGWYELCSPVVINGTCIVNIFNCPTSV